MPLATRTLRLSFALLFVLPAFAQRVPLASRQADFKTFITDVEENYAYLDGQEVAPPDKPWLTWQSRYASAIEHAETKEAFDVVLADCISELHDFHAEVRSPTPNRWLPVPTFADIWARFDNDRAIVLAVRHASDAERAGVLPGDRILKAGARSIDDAVSARLTSAVNQHDPASRDWALLSVLAGRSDESRTFTLATGNAAPRTITLQLQRQFNRPSGPLTSTTLPGNIGLIRFNNSIGDIATVTAFDAALQQLRATRALILDLRDIPSGGDSSVALGIMGCFIAKPLPYQHHRIPNYGAPDIERNWLELVTPRGPFQYTAPVVVLVDHWTGSMAEGIAIGFDGMHRATVIGTEMARLAGAVSDFTLPLTNVDVAFPTEQLFHIDGTPRHTWLPPILVTTPSTPTTDPILDRALHELATTAAH